MGAESQHVAHQRGDDQPKRFGRGHCGRVFLQAGRRCAQAVAVTRTDVHADADDDVARRRGGSGRCRSCRSGRGFDQDAGELAVVGRPQVVRPFDADVGADAGAAVGVSVADSLDADGSIGIRIKWPNDLWTADDRKLAGILIETATAAASAGTAPATRYVVIGIGVNIGPRDGDGLRAPPACLQEHTPAMTAPEAFQLIVAPLVRDVLAFGALGFAPFAERFAARDALRGRDVELSDGTSGRCEGVGAAGELLVTTAVGLQTITSSEVSVRPRRGDAS